MKRFIYIFWIALAFFCGCDTENIISPSDKNLGGLEVSFIYDEASTKSIMLSPAYQTVEIGVKLNFEDMKWNVVSDQSWCVVESDLIHEGNDTFAITVIANEGYDDREPAVVSLCAGEFKTDLRVTQIGNAFVMDQIFGLGMKGCGSVEVIVRTPEGIEWTTRQPEWITVDKMPLSTANGETSYKMTLHWEENPSDSRLGEVELCKKDDKVSSAKYALWQFGDGDGYDFGAQEGNIRVASEPKVEEPLEIRTPSGHIDALQYPEWISIKNVENEDGSTSWLLYFESNPGDTRSDRATQLTYTVLGQAEGKPLPLIYQDDCPVGGLVSADGFALFASEYNAGNDVSYWVTDGVVNVLNSMDMSGLTDEWSSIGTEEHPFNMKFNGGGNRISGFSASASLFGVCDGAEIHDVTLDKTCQITVDDDFDSERLYLAALAGKISDTKISKCVNEASVMLSADAVRNDCEVYVGGLVAYAGPNSVISASTNEGTLNVAERRSESGGAVYIGGLASYVEGNMNSCGNTGYISDKSEAASHYVGGLVGMLNADVELDCSEMPVSCVVDISGLQEGVELMAGGIIGSAEAPLTLTSPKWSGEIKFTLPKIFEKDVCIGGVLGKAGATETQIRGAETDGVINIDSDRTIVWEIPTAVGGIIGCARNGCKVSEASNNADLLWDIYTNKSETGGVVSTGGIIGRVDKGLTEISGCTNNGIVTNYHQHNAKWDRGKLLGARTGGIIGTYGYVRKNGEYEMDFSALESFASNNIRIEDCHTTSEAKVLASRGLVGGIAGYLCNATVEDCSYTGSSLKQDYFWNCNLGGVAGAVENTDIKNCTVKASLSGGAQGSCGFMVGGIVAYLCTDSSVSDCYYFGEIIKAGGIAATTYCGGIVGEAQAGCSVNACSFGGSVLDTQITADNFEDYIVGNKAIVATGCSYWDGE